MNQDFFNILVKLANKDVKFVIIGGFAGVVHGCTVFTQDIDICCEFTPENLLRLQDAIADLHPVHRMTPKKMALDLNEDNCKDLKNLYLDTDAGQLDCLGFVQGIGDYKKALQASRVVEVEKCEFNVLKIESLIEAKKAMNRPHDKEAIIQLEAMRKINKDLKEDK